MRSCDCFIINYGHLNNAMRLAERLMQAGAHASVLSVIGSPDDDHADSMSHVNLLTYPPGHYYGHLWNEAVRLCDAEIMAVITSDVRIADVACLLSRACHAFTTLDRLWCYAPNVDYTPWRYRLGRLHKLSADLYRVPTTDGICWFLRAELVRAIGLLPLSVNYLGWGVDILAGLTCERHDKWVVRDYGLLVKHPAGSGYSRNEAMRQEYAMADHLGITQAYSDYMRRARLHLIERSWRFPAGGPSHEQQRMRRHVRRPHFP